MNSAIHYYAVAQREAALAQDSCGSRHHLADVPIRERRPRGYGVRLLALVRRPRLAPLELVAQSHKR